MAMYSTHSTHTAPMPPAPDLPHSPHKRPAATNPGLDHLRRHLHPALSPVRALFTSRSSAGAWQVRGEQLAALRANWRALNEPGDHDIAACDLLCVVKKPDPQVIDHARRLGKAIVYDIVDAWAQPADGLRCTGLEDARALFRQAWSAVRADGYIFPTRCMARDMAPLVRTGVTIYHHHWPQLAPNPVRPQVRTVGYEGADYLGPWQARIELACAARGLRFVANPRDYNELDIVVLARGGAHGNFLSRRYKSNVKLANAYGAGMPALAHVDEMSAHDTDAGDVLFFTDRPSSFERQLDRLCASHALRQSIHRRFRAQAAHYRVDRVAASFEAFFLHVLGQRQASSPRHPQEPRDD